MVCEEKLWLNLPSDVLRLIFNKLGREKQNVFAQVCRSWHDVADDEIRSLLRCCGQKSLWVLQPETKENIGFVGYKIFSVNENKEIGHVKLPSRECRIFGSSGGWILLSENNKDLELWSPIFDVQIRLPSFRSVCENFPMWKRNCKSIIFGGVGVAVIYGDGKLAFAKYGDLQWSHLCGFLEEERYVDLTCTKDSILALSKNGESIQVWNFEGTNILNIKLDFPPDMAETKDPNKYRHKLYIAEFKGRIFLVVRWMKKFLHSKGIEIYKTANFYVYVLENEDKKRWNRVESLDDQAVFVGKNHTVALRAEDFKECRKNSIYFTDHFCVRKLKKNKLDREYYSNLGVFCLKDSRVEMLQDKCNNFFSFFWIVSGV